MTTNREAFERAERIFVGGVNSPVRAFKSVGGEPLFIERAFGSRLVDVEGREYIDYVGAWGPMILGHAHHDVVRAVRDAAERSFSYGVPTEYETRVGEKVIAMMPSIEKLRFVNSGTEATMSALRVARGFTGRSKIVKFAGCYHGHADFLLVKAGSGAMTFGTPDSKGVTAGAAADTLIAKYNDLESVDVLLAANSGDVAAIIVEPVVGNMGVVPPQPGFLEGLRARCDASGALLVFDEVMTGFRVARGGAQERYRIRPDLTCLGKIIGGGLPVGAYGGSAEIMNCLSPVGPVYQAGTNSGNPIAMAAGEATLAALGRSLYDRLEVTADRLASGLAEIFRGRSVVQRVGSMMTLFFLKPGTARTELNSFDDMTDVDPLRFSAFHGYLRENGIFLPPSAYEAFFISAAHSDEDIDLTLETAGRFQQSIAG